MANLRLVAIKAFDSTTIKARFTEALDPLLNVANVEITANLPGSPNPQVLRVDVTDTVLVITTQPMSPYAAYFVKFQSTDTFRFKSRTGTSFLFEDGITNIVMVLGPEDPADPIRDFLTTYLKDNVYNLETGSLVRDIINTQASYLSKALYDIRQAKSDNYLSFTVEDELKTRGAGPYDRLNEEGVYEVMRVGKTRTGTTSSTSFNFDEFPDGPITLLATSITGEQLVAGAGDSTFDGLILTVKNTYVTKLKKVIIAYQLGGTAVYDIGALGYQILNPTFDQDFASPLFTLANDQFKLSDVILENPDFVLPGAGDTVIVDYEYQQRGRVIDPDTVSVTQLLPATREIVAPLLNQFTLAHAPIVTEVDVLYTVDGIDFLDPSANPPFQSTHPAFITEIPYRFDRVPSHAGEFSVDYSTGNVFVYGAVTNDGTGDFPPTASYLYRKTFVPGLDYTYDVDFVELVASPLRDLSGQTAKINFSYELVLVPDVDYIAQIHQESLDERIDNKLTSLSSLKVNNSPITNVFRIYNETSGEIYTIQRWNESTVYFTFSTPPNILDQINERVSFTDITNELLIVNQELTNASFVRIYKVLLQNNRIIAGSEDVIGASFNTSVSFSRNDIFEKELYYDEQELLQTNLNRLVIGQYQIDYQDGLIYVAVSVSADQDIGTVNYKKSTIAPVHSHVISISELYQSLGSVQGINKRINYVTFGEGFVQPATFDIADERFLDGNEVAPYVVDSGVIIVTDNVKDVRSIFDLQDLNSAIVPTNFADQSTVTANQITLNPLGASKQETLVISGGSVVNVTSIGPGAEIVSVSSVTRISDGYDLWIQTPGTFSNYTITLSGVGTPLAGQPVLVQYNLILNGAATPVVDYNRGDYFIDYSYLADEILVSYEYGDNTLDFRQAETLQGGQQYYVTYRAGALRQALLQNFGTLVNIPILNTLDTSFPRENYRDALRAALQSFTKGPTIPAMKSIVSGITHIDPELIEAAFQNWSLGISRLYPAALKTTGDINLVVGKYDLGVLIDRPDQTITLPISSNLRLEEGTLETWIIPEWDGLDNDANLVLTLTLDGYVLPSSRVYIGSDSHNPVYDDNNSFVLNRKDEPSPIGLPSALYMQTGVFIYYDETAKRWKIYAKDDVTANHTYSGNVVSSGEVYDAQFIPGLGELDDILRSGTNRIDFQFNIDSQDQSSEDGYDGYHDGYQDGYSFDGISFMADDEHYLFDFGSSDNTDRFSLYKDGRGFLNFRVYDSGQGKKKNQYKISTDISDWKAGQKHYIGVSWRLNSSDRRDEMHLFIDGLEVPNIMKYGGLPAGISTDRFRTVKPEHVAGTVPKNAIAGNDLLTQSGSNIVQSELVNFQARGILAGDTLTIMELGFSTYNVTAVNGFQLTLDASMPASLDDARYSVNEYSVIVVSEIDLYSNILVSIVSSGVETEIPGLRATIPGYQVSKNSQNQNVLTILGDAQAGDSIVIRTVGLNHRRIRERHLIWGNTSSVLKTQLPSPINLDEVKIIAVPIPLTPIGPNNSVLALGVFTATLQATQPTNQSEGRFLSIRMTGGNVSFSPSPAQVTIHGTTAGGPTSETIVFTGAGTHSTTNKFKTITSVVVVVTPLITTRTAVSVEIKELDPITISEGNNLYPVIRFSYKTQTGKFLQGIGSNPTIFDNNGFFAESNVNQKLVIYNPAGVAGTYTITSRIDNNTITVSPAPAVSFTNGVYDIFNVSLGRSGFQNGFFTLETAGEVNVPYLLSEGIYEFDFSAHLEIPFRPVSRAIGFLGSDRHGSRQAKAVLDEFRILSRMLTDIRVGETLALGQDSITTDYTRLKQFKPNSSTLVLLHMDSLPLINSADYWASATKEFVQSGNSLNSNFNQSLLVTRKPLVVDNRGLFTTNSEGTVEFWVSPRFDTYNDPNIRMYFDASGSVVEEVTSITNGTVKVSGRIAQVLSVRLVTDTQHTGPEFFGSGAIGPDFQTILLQNPLPFQQTPVRVNYVPSGLAGDRMSIYKDTEGFLTMNVSASGLDYQVRQPIFWSRDTWHRVQATYRLNRPDHKDELRLFVDGEERGVIVFGSGLIFGDGTVFGQGFSAVSETALVADINFTDPINQFYIGSDYLGVHPAEARIDNLRLSNTARKPLSVAGQLKDINYSSNLDFVFPVVPDAFTTYLLDFDSIVQKIDDFALLRNAEFGIFDFTLNIIDSFGIVSGNAKIKQVLENLIMILRPAQSRVTINYV